MIKRLLRISAYVSAWLFLAWAFGALWFDLPLPPSIRKVAALIFLIVSGWLWLCGGRRGRIITLGVAVTVTAWWFTLSPSNDRAWTPDVEQVAWAEIQGDEVTLHNVRNCDYRTETDYTPRWETRTVRLSQITGIDLAACYWGSPYMAHPIVSFQFIDTPPVCFSIETRKEIGESYSALAGFYRQYELIYTVADERDVIRLRTNFRSGEDVYLYHLNASPENARGRFMEYITTLNHLRLQPAWYNAATTNCTTAIRTQHDSTKRAPWDWRILVNGKGDQMMFERGLLKSGDLSFAELKLRSLINPTVIYAAQDPSFSKLIRQHLSTLTP